MSQNIDKVNNALNQIGDLMDDGFLLVDKHGNIEFANSSAEEFLGKELSRRNVTEVIKSKD